MIEIVSDAENDGRKTIVFTFFRDTAEKAARLLGDRCIGIINGSVPPAKRQALIDAFETSKNSSVLVSQIQSGGTGLNVQSASVVIICEPQFKPSIENQAISHAYRMGQTRSVLVHRLLCINTVDERIHALLEEKQKLFDAFADKSNAAAMTAAQGIEIDGATFGSIIAEEIERIKKENPRLASEIARENRSHIQGGIKDLSDTSSSNAAAPDAKSEPIKGKEPYGLCDVCGSPLMENARFCAYCGSATK